MATCKQLEQHAEMRPGQDKFDTAGSAQFAKFAKVKVETETSSLTTAFSSMIDTIKICACLVV